MAEFKPYSCPITRNSPSSIIFLVDRSGSMDERMMLGDDCITKAEAVARILNHSLTELGMRCRRSDGVRHYFDVSVIGYWGNTIESLLEESCGTTDIFVPISHLESANVNSITYKLFSNNPMRPPSHINVREYITPHAEGKTPMNGAIQMVTKELKGWIKEHKGLNCHPPIVINISDGHATDANIATIESSAKILTDLATECGKILLFNINLSADSTPENQILFPNSPQQIEHLGNYAKMLFNISSILPQVYQQRVAQMKEVAIEQVKDCRAMGFNTSATDFIKFISIGSISINMIR